MGIASAKLDDGRDEVRCLSPLLTGRSMSCRKTCVIVGRQQLSSAILFRILLQKRVLIDE